MPAFKLRYIDGREIRRGDRVLVDRTRQAVVSAILYPGSKEARDHSCPEGGIFLDFNDGDAQVWPRADEDLEFLRGQDEGDGGDGGRTDVSH